MDSGSAVGDWRRDVEHLHVLEQRQRQVAQAMDAVLGG
jgi:hypothetical protein